MDRSEIKVLMISTDRNILAPGSAVSERMKEYGELVSELHIVLLSDSSHNLKNTELSKNIWVYPTNSFIKWFRSHDAERIGKKIIFDKKFVRGKSLITTQDPFECGIAGLKIKNKWRIPLEVQIHTNLFSPYFSGFLNSIRKRVARKVIKSAESIRVVSRQIGDEVVREYQSSGVVNVLPIYVDKDRILAGKVKLDLHGEYGFKTVLLSVSRLSPEKNITASIEVLRRVKEFAGDTGLVIVGSGPEEAKLKSLVKKLGLVSSVIFVGWQEDLTSYYKTADIFIQTSEFEGYGLSLVEAAISGLPIVTTPVGIATELSNGLNAYICPQNDPEYMFKAVYDLVADIEKRKAFASNTNQFIEANVFSKEEYLRRLISTWVSTSLKIPS
ncbi:MAG: poly(glycerol-phosphate) alpha-glucosyltransferase [Parcubacteria bacterium C7867-005]|nr:MAG: poly(glycerol-phosphate) alpha-glucosyltransferase [Parcubacteria bacterium C7867-005]